jgi:hypothetical protein
LTLRDYRDGIAFMATLILGKGTSAFDNSQRLRGAWKPREAAPIGLIFVAEPSREQVELLQTHKDCITMAEYWTERPPKAEPEQKLHTALLKAQERLARRGVLLGELEELGGE